MGVGRRIGPVAIAFLLGITAPLAAPAGNAMPETSGTGHEPLAIAVATDRGELTPPAPESIDRVGGGGFVTMPWQPGALGDPDVVIDRVMAEAVDRAHRRIVDADLSAEAGDDIATLTELDSGWDGWNALLPEHRLRRLRQIANLIPEHAGHEERVLEFDSRYTQTASSEGGGVHEELMMLRYLKDALKSMQNGTFFTRERVALLLGGLLAIGLLSRVATLRK
jgi:hypothetical protein